MNKKLNAKIQKLIPNFIEPTNVLSSCIAIEPPEKELILKKGSVYTVFDIKSPMPMDPSLIGNVINDVLFDSYYHSENISPIQSLEKSIAIINEKITALAAQSELPPTNKENPQKLEFNITASVLWGNVFYVVHYGKGKSFLMRDGEIKEVTSTAEGNYAVASGVVNPDDVIVLSTEEFTKNYPPEKLLSTSISATELENSQSCMILKFIVNAELSEDELIDFEVNADKTSSKLNAFLENVKNKAVKKEPETQTIATLAGATELSAPKKENVPNVKVRSKIKTNKIKSQYVIIAVAILLFISLFITIASKNKSRQAQKENENNGALTLPLEPENEAPQESTAQEEQGITELKLSETFYDLKLSDARANPADVVIFNNTLVVTDSTLGKIFTSSLTTPKFDPIENANYPNIKNTNNYNNKLNFTYEGGYVSFDLVENIEETKYEGSFGIVDTYLGNIYSIENNTLNKYVVSGGNLTKSVWAESENFGNATSMSISYSIYVTTNNNLLVYTQGNQANFQVSGLETPFSKLVDVATGTNFKNIYLADAGNNRVVVITTNGAFVKEIREEAWDNIKSISVNNDESTMFVLSGSKVYQVSLK